MQMDMFSYFDDCTAFVYFNCTPRNPSHWTAAIRAALDLPDTTAASSQLGEIGQAIVKEDYADTYIHELHHFYQTVFYPYHYFRSWRLQLFVERALSELRQSPGRHSVEQLRRSIDPDWRYELRWTTLPVTLGVSEGHLTIQNAIDSRHPGRHDTTLSGLAEEATMVFQYRLSIGRPGTGAEYKEWLGAHRSPYATLFNLLSDSLTEDDALAVLQPLVHVAFMTTHPLQSLVRLANILLSQRKSSLADIGSEQIHMGLCRWLVEALEIPFATIDDLRSRRFSLAVNEPWAIIDMTTYADLIDDTSSHTAFPIAMRFIQRVRDDPHFQLALYHPYAAGVLDILKYEFVPPVTTIRIHHPLLTARHTTGYLNPVVRRISPPTSVAESYTAYYHDVRDRTDLAHSLLTDLYDDLERTCPHEACPYFPGALCRRWSRIPADFGQCRFPSFLSRLGVSYDTSSGELVV